MGAEHVTINHPAEAGVVADVVRKCQEPKIISLNGGHGLTGEVLLVPDTSRPGNVALHTSKSLLEKYRDAPERRSGTATLDTLASLIAHVNRNKDDDSVLFAEVGDDASEPKLFAVYDYNRKGPDGAPRFGTHRAVYEFPISDEWTAWFGQSGKPLSQSDFARFIEDRLADIADPTTPKEFAKEFAKLFSVTFASASKLLELSKGLHVHVGSKVENRVNPNTGEAALVFVTDHTDAGGKRLDVPGAFLLALPIFTGGARYQIPVRLRYRVNGGDIKWFFELHRAKAAFDHAIDEASDEAQKATGLPLFKGTPEA